MSVCRSCGAPIVWALSEHGRRMPLDAEPYSGGPEDRLIERLRMLLDEQRGELRQLGILEVVDDAIAAYDGSFDPRGLFVLRGSGETRTAVAVTPDSFPGEEIFRSHFATCPQADRWRQPS